MAINFPSTTGQATDGSFTHVVGYVTYKWNGVSWNASVSGGGGGGGIALTDISIVKPNPTASGSGDVTYNSTLGAFTYTPSEIFSGSYTDLTNKPTIPTALSNIVDSAQGVNVTGRIAAESLSLDVGGSITAAGTTLDFQNSTISFSGASIGGLQSTINAGVDVHLNTSGASSGEILSWNGTDYAWVADQTGGGGSSGLSVSIPHGATDTTKTFVAADANSINGTVTDRFRIYVLPQGSTLTLGDQFYIFDIGDDANSSGNAATYNISITPHSGDRIQGAAADTPYIIASNAGSVRLIWMGSTPQWRVFQ